MESCMAEAGADVAKMTSCRDVQAKQALMTTMGKTKVDQFELDKFVERGTKPHNPNPNPNIAFVVNSMTVHKKTTRAATVCARRSDLIPSGWLGCFP